MKLNDKQLELISRACESVDYGSVTIKMNKTNKFIDVVIENQIRMENESTVKQIDKMYKSPYPNYD